MKYSPINNSCYRSPQCTLPWSKTSTLNCHIPCSSIYKSLLSQFNAGDFTKHLPKFTVNDFGTVHCSSSKFIHVGNFKFTDYETTDSSTNTFTQLVNFRFTNYGTKDNGSNTFTHQFPYHWLRTVDHDSNTLNKKINCDQVFWSCSNKL